MSGSGNSDRPWNLSWEGREGKSQSGGANGSVVPVGKNSSRGSNQYVEARGLSKDRVWGRVNEAAGRGEVKVAVGK